MRKINFLTLATLFFTVLVTAQTFDVSGEIRPRFEYGKGLKKLMTKDGEGDSFISQRSRLNFNYKHEKISLGIVLQNVRVWGDVKTITVNDNANSFHQAWAAYQFTDNFSMKFGRQEIIYDDSRIFGNVGWAQQARSFDAIIANIKTSEKGKLALGYSLSNDKQQYINSIYTNAAGYKSFLYGWYHRDMGDFGWSLLALNLGKEFKNSEAKEEVNYSQTIGSRITYTSGNVSFDGAAYIQTGKIDNATVNANNFAANMKYKATSEFSLGLGTEYLSGKNQDDSSGDIKSFNPVFGTNHKFNGYMDYFYVGNHKNNVGLLDIHATLGYSKNKFSAKIIPHVFSSAADIYNAGEKQDKNLGVETDMVLGYKISKNVSVNGGYSQMFGTESLELLKGGDKDENNSWAWLMISFKPNLFTSKKVDIPQE